MNESRAVLRPRKSCLGCQIQNMTLDWKDDEGYPVFFITSRRLCLTANFIDA